MNPQIPSPIDLAMRKHVERAVRPVRAGKAKKLTMREELLGHLTAIYIEELEQRADQQAAFQAATGRFGDPGTLTAELNASVGWMERIEYWESVIDQQVHSWFDYRRDESWLHFALRWATFFGLFNAFVGVLLLSVATAQSRIGDASGFSVLGKVLLLLTVTQPAGLAGLRGVYRALMGRRTPSRWLVAIVHAVAWSALELFLVVAFWWSIVGLLPTNNQQMANVITSFLIFLPVFLLFGGWLCTMANRNQDKHAAWTTLLIDE